MIKKVIILMLFSVLSPLHGWKGRVFPVSYNTTTGQWSILLIQAVNSGVYHDFFDTAQRGEKGNVVALRALAKATNGIYSDPKIFDKMPWYPQPFVAGSDVIHFVDVSSNFKTGSELHTHATAQSGYDFLWITGPELNDYFKTAVQEKKSFFVMRGKKSIGVVIGQESYEFLANYLNDALAKITALRSTNPSAGPSSHGASSSGGGAGSSGGSGSSGAPVTKLPAKGESWDNIPGAIYFYNKTDPYYEFTNFFDILPNKFNINGKQWITSEHYFQAEKFNPPSRTAAQLAVYNEIVNAQTPGDVFRIAQKNKAIARQDWISKGAKYAPMLTALREKFSARHPNLQQLLLGTGHAILVENTKSSYGKPGAQDDPFWGNGWAGTGDNDLGRMLMHVREELQRSAETGKTVQFDYDPNVRRDVYIPGSSGKTAAPSTTTPSKAATTPSKPATTPATTGPTATTPASGNALSTALTHLATTLDDLKKAL